jgi:mycothiol synthase
VAPYLAVARARDLFEATSTRVERVERLTGGQLSEMLSLVKAATCADKVSPLSEEVLLAARGGHTAGLSTTWPHFLTRAGTHLSGYAHLEERLAGGPAIAEVVVDPVCRRQGVGTALIHALEGALGSQSLRLWSHGHLEGASAFARRDGYSTVRELWQMRRSLRSEAGSLPLVNLPEGFRARRFVVGQDEVAWLQVNARAFVHHPEQGRMTRQDLDRRICEPWFDESGFILIEDTSSPTPLLAASHWTKVVDADSPDKEATEGEVYVVGVDPAYQGLGLGRAVTLLGLEYLRDQGLSKAMLYVDADNRAAVATYSRLGFTRSAVDVMYSRAVHPPV